MSISAVTPLGGVRRARYRRIAQHEAAIARERLAMCVLALRESGDDSAADDVTRLRDALGRVQMGAEQ